MAIRQTDYATGKKPMPIAQGSELVSVRMVLNLAAVLAINDVVEFGFLPPDHVPVSIKFDHDDLSDTAAGEYEAGILTTAGTAVSTDAADGGAKWKAAVSNELAAAGSEAPLATELGHLRVTPSATTARKIGAVITEACTTTATGVFACTLTYRAAHYAG